MKALRYWWIRHDPWWRMRMHVRIAIVRLQIRYYNAWANYYERHSQ